LYTPGVLCPRSPLIGRRRMDNFLGGSQINLMLCLANILLNRLPVFRTWRKSDRGGFLVRLRGSNRHAEGPSFLFGTIIIFPESILENSNSSWRLSLSHRDLVLCIKVEIMHVFWRKVGVMRRSGRGLCGSGFGTPYVTDSRPVSSVCRCRERKGGPLPSCLW